MMSDRMITNNFHNQNGTKHNANPSTQYTIIGVIGICATSSELVKKLIESGHMVNIWSRNRRKCNLLQANLGEGFKNRLKTHLSARAVLKSSHVVLNYVSDHKATERIIRYNFGINSNTDDILQGKGFVQMTNVDPGTSVKIKGLIEVEEGRYLEAQMQKGRQGKLLFLTAGNKTLFDECCSCFDAIGGDAFYYGEVGYATTISLILQQMKGVCLAALTEGLAVANNCEIKQEDFLKVLKSTSGIFNSYLLGHANAIMQKHFTNGEQSIGSMQNGLNASLNLSRDVGQAMFLAATANEILKCCESVGYGGHDVSAISRFHI